MRFGNPNKTRRVIYFFLKLVLGVFVPLGESDWGKKNPPKLKAAHSETVSF